MARPKRVTPSIGKEIQFDSDLFAKLQLELYSTLEERVPHGRLSQVVNEAIRMWLEARGVTL